MATILRLNVSPGDSFQVTRAHRFGGQKYLFAYTYRPSLSAWYLDILFQDRSPLKTGIRLEAGALITEGLLDFPYTLAVDGPQRRPARREDLGDTLFIAAILP